MQPSYVHGASATPLLGQTIGENLDRAVERYGDREALVSCHQDVRYTYAELGEAVDRLARNLLASGLEPGDRLGIWSPNRAEWVLVQYATAKAGIVLVNVNPSYRTSELEYALRQSGCRALIAAPAFKTSDYAAMIEEVRGDAARARAGRALRVARVGRARGRRRADAELPPCQFDDAINIQYTSGTTGFPKGATLSHANILNNGYFVAEGCRHTEQDRVCIPVPFYHCFGMVMGNLGCTTHGACMVIPEAAFDAEATLRAVQAGALHEPLRRADDVHRPARAPALRRPSTSPACARGSWPARRARSRPCAAWSREMHMEEVTICYGMTETSPVSTQTGADDPLEQARRHRRARAPARGDQGRRSRDGPDRGPRGARRAVHARLQRDARLLERAGARPARRSTARAGCTRATSP